MKEEIVVLNTRVDLDKLISYYRDIEENYPCMKWHAEYSNTDQGVGGHILHGVTGWALQSNLQDLDKPCPPYNITKENKSVYRDTKLMFGYIKEIQKIFPFGHQFSIAVHPPGTFINFHSDTDNYLKIHVAIKTNSSAYFMFEPDKKYVLPADGSMILVNTQINHGTLNEGDTDRIHLFFKIPKESEEEVSAYKESTI